MSPRRLLTPLAVAVLVAASGCGVTTSTPPSGPSASATSSGCHRNPGHESLNGPLNWKAYGTFTQGTTWLASQGPWDHGMITFDTTQPIVLDSVTLAQQNPALFAPAKILGAWVSPSSAPLKMVRSGKWPARMTPVACQTIQPQPDPKAEKVLVVRLQPTIGAAADGRQWSSDRGVVVHYHTLDGTPYAAPYGYVNVWPTSPTSDPGSGVDILTGRASPAPSPGTPSA